MPHEPVSQSYCCHCYLFTWQLPSSSKAPIFLWKRWHNGRCLLPLLYVSCVASWRTKCENGRFVFMIWSHNAIIGWANPPYLANTSTRVFIRATFLGWSTRLTPLLIHFVINLRICFVLHITTTCGRSTGGPNFVKVLFVPFFSSLKSLTGLILSLIHIWRCRRRG